MPTGNGSAEPREVADWTIGAVPDWGPTCLDDLVEALVSTESPFPCTFAVAAAKKRTLRFGFVDDLDDVGSWTSLTTVISAYLDTYQALSKDTSLVVFFRPQRQVRPIEEYHAKFWSVLQYLHDHDPERWPAAVPEDPDDPMWEFSFGGTSIFVVCNTPSHTRRRSRYSPGFVITFQPRWVFEGLEPESARGAAARRVIRKRLRAFDGTAPSAALGNYGDPANREWRQYFLPDKNTDAEMGCPFHAGKRNRPAAEPPAATAPPAAAPPATSPPTGPGLLPRPGPSSAERRRALHRRLLVEAGLAARPGGHPGGASRGGREKPRRPAATPRVWLVPQPEPSAR
ncbi:MAG TPA: YqcI/YcgG family protein [Pseudonocardia sp.]|uniref:YqcI/YcgG family protein n=1 Tax=Pseudonocardia sp. TaxID=60912 RepID=UPI002BBEDF91|nr:YqcI/YcgG family protein [Pseudonocardia sp.]HTF48613.1 YqcI/YcgG family protein [Pseudonocardia sp.]